MLTEKTIRELHGGHPGNGSAPAQLAQPAVQPPIPNSIWHHPEDAWQNTTATQPAVQDWQPGEVAVRPLDFTRVAYTEQNGSASGSPTSPQSTPWPPAKDRNHHRHDSAGHHPTGSLHPTASPSSVSLPTPRGTPALGPQHPPAPHPTNAGMTVPASKGFGFGPGNDPWPWWLIVVLVVLSIVVFVVLCEISKTFSRVAGRVLTVVFWVLRRVAGVVWMLVRYAVALLVQIGGMVVSFLAKGAHALIATRLYNRAQDEPWDPRTYPRRRNVRMPVGFVIRKGGRS